MNRPRLDGADDLVSARSVKSTHTSGFKLHKPVLNDGDEAQSVPSVRSVNSRGSDDTLSVRSSSALSRSSSGSTRRSSSSSLATSFVSLRDLESQKAEIEAELQRVQQELEQRQLQERRSRAERPLALLPPTARDQTKPRPVVTPSSETKGRQATAISQVGNQHR